LVCATRRERSEFRWLTLIRDVRGVDCAGRRRIRAMAETLPAAVDADPIIATSLPL
jgi:hypothetical protein